VILTDGWSRFSIWEHSERVKDLYASRARGEQPEMTCAAQAAELLKPLIAPGDSLLDAGCGSGYFFHSLRARGIDVEYYGVDASETMIEIGRRELAAHGLPPERLMPLRIEDLHGSVEHVLCMNVLSNIDNFHRPLERLLRMATKSLILRESLKVGAEYLYVRDRFLDEGCGLKVHVNAYDIGEVTALIESEGFRVRRVTDERTGGEPEDVIGYPHYWTFLEARRV
jgi:SAM-dependent methyltransferase